MPFEPDSLDEEAMIRLHAQRRFRLKRLKELKAPAQIIGNEEKLFKKIEALCKENKISAKQLDEAYAIELGSSMLENALTRNFDVTLSFPISLESDGADLTDIELRKRLLRKVRARIADTLELNDDDLIMGIMDFEEIA